jgi:uncharacterized membrane protein
MCAAKAGVANERLQELSRRVGRAATRLVIVAGRHWLAFVNLAFALILTVQLGAPWLMEHGQERLGRLIYLANYPLCHQLPERSFFIGGPRFWYTLSEMRFSAGSDIPLRWLGNSQLGFKVAVCERCMAINVAFLAFGLLFALVRSRLKGKGIPWQVAVALIVPLAVDAGIQLVGLLESDWIRRSITGALFSLAMVAFVYPVVDQALRTAADDARAMLESTYADE